MRLILTDHTGVLLWNMKYARVVAVCIYLLIVGCATSSFKPVTFDCTKLGLTPVSRISGRIEFEVFSILPPEGNFWCVQNREKYGVVFGKLLLGGKALERPPTTREAAHSLVAIAQEVGIADGKIESPEDTKVFVERWLSGGASVRMERSKVVLDISPAERFKLIDSRVALEEFQGTVCVKHSATLEERDNPRVPGSLLVQTLDNFLCKHPHTAAFVLIGYSERRVKDEPSALGESIKKELEPFMKSLRFKPVL